MKRGKIISVVIIISLLLIGCEEKQFYNYYIKNKNINSVKILLKFYDSDKTDSLAINFGKQKLIRQYVVTIGHQNNIGTNWLFDMVEAYHDKIKSSTDFSQDTYWKYTVIDSDTAEFVLEIDSSYFDWGKSILEVP
jgi:hypothetical protein